MAAVKSVRCPAQCLLTNFGIGAAVLGDLIDLCPLQRPNARFLPPELPGKNLDRPKSRLTYWKDW